MKDYVLGFLFSPELHHVVLIEKKRPEWQAGLLNGVGGRIEEGETDLEAMRREFREEAGMEVDGWIKFARFTNPRSNISIFAATGDAFSARTMSDEEVMVCGCHSLIPSGTIPNLAFLIPMAKAVLRLPADTQMHFDIAEHPATLPVRGSHAEHGQGSDAGGGAEGV